MNLCLAEYITRNQSLSGFAVLNNSVVQKFHVYIEHLTFYDGPSRQLSSHKLLTSDAYSGIELSQYLEGLCIYISGLLSLKY